MAKILIVKNDDLSILSKYEADQPKQHEYGGPWGQADYCTHVAVPAEIDADCVELSRDEEDAIVVAEDAAAKAAKDAATAQAAARAALAAAKAFGNSVIEDFTLENMALGITVDGMTGDVRKATVEVMSALSTGSLYDAIDEIRAIPAEKKDPKYITDARLLAAINKIETFLGIALSEEL